MRIGLFGALGLATLWSLLAIGQLWWSWFSTDNFLKLSLTLGILVGIILLVSLALREFGVEKRLKDQDYIDG